MLARMNHNRLMTRVQLAYERTRFDELRPRPHHAEDDHGSAGGGREGVDDSRSGNGDDLARARLGRVSGKVAAPVSAPDERDGRGLQMVMAGRNDRGRTQLRPVTYTEARKHLRALPIRRRHDSRRDESRVKRRSIELTGGL